jgi:hypothetical protein
MPTNLSRGDAIGGGAKRRPWGQQWALARLGEEEWHLSGQQWALVRLGEEEWHLSGQRWASFEHSEPT